MHELGTIVEAIGSWCSIVSLLLTGVIAWKLKNISRDFLFQARFPALMQKITSHRSTIVNLLNTYPDSSNEIRVELQKCHANLKSLKPKLKRDMTSTVSRLLTRTGFLSGSSTPLFKEKVREVYLDLVLLEAELKNLSEDFKWRTRE